MKRQEPARTHRWRLTQTPYNDILGALVAGGLAAGFCLLLLWRKPWMFWVDDYQLSVLPVFTDVARSWSEGELPLLSPYSWVCGNLAGEFQYGTFSVFVNAAVVAIWSFALSFEQQAAALSITHLFVLAAGGYALARGRDLPAAAAMIVGLVAALNGWIICWGASDWFGALGAFAWLPWSWWALEFAIRRTGPRWRALLPAPFVYLLIAGGFPYTVLMLGVVTAWLGLRALIESRDWRAPLALVPGWLLGLGLSAPAWLSLIETSRGSRRASEVLLPRQWLVPFDALPGLAIPSWTVQWRRFEEVLDLHAAVELANGLVPTVVLVAAALILRKRFFITCGWELGLLTVALAMSMLPGAGMFRFSFRWLPLFHLISALIAAQALQHWRVAISRRPGWGLHNLGTWTVLITGATALVMALTGQLSSAAARQFALTFVAIGATWWVLEAMLPHQRNFRAWLPNAVVLGTLFLTYTRMDPHAAVAKFAIRDDLNSPVPLSGDRLYLSLYQPPPLFYRTDQTGWSFGAAVRPGSTSMFAGVHLVNGYSPVSPAGIGRLLDFGTHGNINPARVEEIVLPESGPDGLLAELGIDGIIVAWDFDFKLPGPLPAEWQIVHKWSDGYVYHRAAPRPHVRARRGEGFTSAEIHVVENSRHRVVADVSPTDSAGPIALLFSRPFFPGYKASLDGEQLPVTVYRGLIPTVEIPAGRSGRLEIVYRPMPLVVGGSVAAVSAVLLIIAFVVTACRPAEGLETSRL